MKTLLRLAVATLMCLTTTAYAEDLFPNKNPIPFEFGRPLAESDTIGGYPIWQGDGKWRLMHLEVNTPAGGRIGLTRLIPIPLGRVYLIQVEQGKLVSSMQVLANLAQGRGDGWASEPCKREDFLWKKSLGDEFIDVNCVTVYHITNFPGTAVFKPYLTKLQQDNVALPPTVLRITVSRYSTLGRGLVVQVNVNPELYGFQRETERVWAANPWHKEFALKDPKKKEFIDRLAQWAEAFAVQVGGPAFRKDAKAFSGLPGYHVGFQGSTYAPLPSPTQSASNPALTTSLPFLTDDARSRIEKEYGASQQKQNKALALTEAGGWGTALGRATPEVAIPGALSNCQQRNPRHPCIIAAENDRSVFEGNYTTEAIYNGALELLKRASLSMDFYFNEDRDEGISPTQSHRNNDVGAPTPRNIPGAKTITTRELVELLKSSKPVLINVRPWTEGAFAIPGTIWIQGMGRAHQNDTQRSEHKSLLAQVAPDTNIPLVLYSSNWQGWLSYNASLTAVELEYKNVYWYRGGMAAWNQANLPVMRTKLLKQF